MNKIHMNKISAIVGSNLILLGIVCLSIRGFIPDRLSVDGYLEEPLFLVIGAFALMFAGFVVFLGSGLYNIMTLLSGKAEEEAPILGRYLGVDFGMLLFCSGGLFVLFGTNSDVPTDIPGMVMMTVGMILFVASVIQVYRASR